jgi:hypothetical protein
LRQAAKLAKQENAQILAETTSRLARSHLYDPKDRPDAQPTEAEFQSLQEYVEGVPLVTALDPDATPGEERAYQTKRGQQAKGHKGGRPPKRKTGYKKLRRETVLPRVLELRQLGATISQIALLTGVPRMTIFGWLRRYPCGCTVFSPP